MNEKRKNRKRIWKRTAAAILLVAITIKDTYVAYAGMSWAWHPTYSGEYNDSDQLYEWIRLDDDRTDISTLVKPSYHGKIKGYNPYSGKAYDKEFTCYRMLLIAEYEGKTYFYQADPSRWVRDGKWGDNYGKSMINVDDAPQVQPGKKSFVTRGGLQAFYVEKKWICDWSDDDYKGDYQYEIYPCKPGTDDINEEVTLWYTKGVGKVYDVWYYDRKGQPVGNDASEAYWKDPFWFRADWGETYENWTLSRYPDDEVAGCPAFVFTPRYKTGNDSHLRVDTLDGVVSLTDTNSTLWSTSSVHFGIYVGQPMDMEFATSSDTKFDYVAAFTSPYLIRRDQEYVVEKDGVLFVNDVVLIRGKIVNRGLIVVGNKGCIIQLDDDDSTQSITNEGGDLIVKKGGYVSVDELISKERDGRWPQIVNYGNILVEKKIELEKSLVDNSGQLYGGYVVQSQVLGTKVVSPQRGDKKKIVQLADNFSLYHAVKRGYNGFQYDASQTKFVDAPGSKRDMIKDKITVFWK